MKKVMIVIIILIVLVIGYFGNTKYQDLKNKLDVEFKNDLTVEIGSEAKLSDFVLNIKNGDVLNGDDIIDTSKLGNIKATLVVKNKENIEEKVNFKVKVVDLTSPDIEAKKEVTSYVGRDIDLLGDVKVTDNSKEDIEAKVVGDYDINTEGKYELKYVASDSSGNKGEYDFILNIVSDKNNRVFKTSKGFLAKVVDGVTYIDGILVVNKTYSIPSNYGNGITSETKEAFNKMQTAAKEQGLNLWLSSGYRSYSLQQSIYNNYVARDGKTAADTYSARAGHSEHQTGLAFDLNTIEDSFAYTNEGKWVHDNCYKYGLILRYPKGKDNITGYKYESWHLRYVGVALATKLYNDGDWITLEEYFGIDSKYAE